MKIYCILCDAMPPLPEIKALAAKHDLQYVRQVGGCVTDNSMTQLFTGKMPSDYLNQGFGYHTNQLDSYRDDITQKIAVPWYHETILHQLQHSGWKIHLHNAVPDSWYKGDVYTDSWPGGYNERYRQVLRSKDRFYAREMMNSIFINNDVDWQLREDRFIRSLSLSEEKEFYFIEYLHFHSYGTIARGLKEDGPLKAQIKKRITRNLISLLSTYDFDEPNSIFWIFSDHGPHKAFDVVPLPDSYLSWVLIKNNFLGPDKIRVKLISMQDFPNYVKNTLGHEINFDLERTKRVYFVEDGRKNVDAYNSTTATAIMMLRENPFVLLQVCYYTIEDQYYCHLTNVDKNESIQIKENDARYGGMIRRLKKRLKSRFSWVP